MQRSANCWPAQASSKKWAGAFGSFRACRDRKSTRLNSSHLGISYAVFCFAHSHRDRHPFPTRRSSDLLLEARLLERVLGSPQGEKTLHALAQEVAERKKDPYAAVSELLARAGLK